MVGPVATVTLSRPESRNRIEPGLAAQLQQVFAQVAEDDVARVLVLTGFGDDFSVGREPLPAGLSAAERQGWIEQLQVANTLGSLSTPVIVAINGDAFDHGLELALAGDLRVAAAGAKLGFTDLSRQNCFPWDGGTQRLPRLVGPAWASDLLLTSRLVDATEALAIGLVNRVVPADQLLQEAQDIADRIAAGGPIAARYAKEAIGQGLDLSLAQGLALEADLNIILQSTSDRAEGLRCFGEKSTPNFVGY